MSITSTSFGRTWQVNIQADPRFRERPADIAMLQVRNNQGADVAPGHRPEACATPAGRSWVMRLQHVLRHRHYRQHPRPGPVRGRRFELVQKITASAKPKSMASEWTELTYLQLQAGNTAMYVFRAGGWVFVFLVLAGASTRAGKLPLAVILVVPMCLLCSVVGGSAGPGWRVTIFYGRSASSSWWGWPAKNAILIVEFAKQQQESGVELRQATLEAVAAEAEADPDDVVRLPSSASCRW